MTAKLILITGIGRGIGRDVALQLSTQGFKVSGCARSEDELEETRRLSKDEIEVSKVDVSCAEALTKWIDSELSRHSSIPWGLVTAAGIHGSIGPLISANWEEWKSGIEVNLFGTALACKQFASYLVKNHLAGRIVLFSGGGATQPIENMTSYCASKAAVVRFGETLAQELLSHKITVNAVAPGAVNTALTQTIIEAGNEKAGSILWEKTKQQLKEGGVSSEHASALVSHLMSELSAPITGKLISAVWDDWKNLHKNPSIISNKELYTLRRVIQKEQLL